MGTERTATLNIALAGDDVDIRAFLSSVKTQFKNTVAEIEGATSKLNLFGQIETNIPKIKAALASATDAAAAFAAEIERIKKNGGTVGDELKRSFDAALKSAAEATREYTRQNAQLETLRGQLRGAGVDTKNLAAEQQRLALATRQAADAAAVQAAKQALGVTTMKDTEASIQRLNAAYETLRKSGTLTPQELVIAQQQLRQRISETQDQVTALATSAKAGGSNLGAMFTGSVLPALGITATIGGLVAALAGAVKQANAVKQALAEIGSVTTLTPAQLDALSEGAKRLAVTIGLDVNEALRGLRELIQSGVPQDNALSVLEVAARASKASLSDLTTGVKAANLLLDSFGAEVDDLSLLFDKLAVAQHNGGVELKTFADNAGPLLNIARDAGVGFDELTAVLSVMANKSGDAAGAIANLGKIIVGLQTEQAREKLDAMGISTRNLVEIFQELGRRNITLQQFLDLDIGSRKAAGSIAALTNNTELLVPALDRARNALGEVKKANDALQDSPKERADRFNAQLQLAATNIGNLVGSGSRLGTVATDILRLFNQVPEGFERTAKTASDANASVLDVAKAFFYLSPEAAKAASATKEFEKAQADAEKQTAATEAALKKLTAALAGVAERLIADVKAMQDATAKTIASINARAEAEIAALDRSKEATAQTAAETLAIQIKAADDKLAAITKNEAAITAALESAAAARSKLVETQTGSAAKAAAEAAKIRITGIAAEIKDHEALQTTLTAQVQARLGRVAELERQRVDFNAGIERDIFNTRLQGLSAFDQYVAKATEVERLISEARIAGARGDIATATKFTNEAIALAKSLGPVYSANGAQIVNASQASETALGKIRKAQRELNEDIERQQGLEQNAAEELQSRLLDVSAKLVILQVRFNNLQHTINEGFEAKIELDTASADRVIEELNRITADRTVKVRVELDTSAASGLKLGEGTLPLLIPGNNAGGYIGRTIQALREGGTVGALVQRFAGGGTVFRRPSWSKVPGVGDADTVPAALPVGSYVVRKAASGYYGDALMSILSRGLLARAFGGGGLVEQGLEAMFHQTGLFGPMLPGLFGIVAPGTTSPQSPGASAQQAFQVISSNISGEHSDEAAYALAYARAVLERLGNSSAVRSIFGLQLLDVQARMRAVEANPFDQAAANALVNSVGLIGSNLHLLGYWERSSAPGVTAGDFLWSDFLAAVKSGAIGGVGGGSVGAAPKVPGIFGSGLSGFFNVKPVRRAAGGAIGADTVPAMLTPGEYVLQPRAVESVSRLFGGGFLRALNAMRLPRDFFAGLRDFAPPPRPLAFAGGGPVPGPLAPQHFANGGAVRGRAAPTININITAQTVDEAEVRRSILPAIERIMRRSR